MAALVVGGDLLLLLGDDLALPARAADHAVGGLLQGVGGDDVAADAGGEQCGLVEDVGQVGAGHAGGALGQGVEVGVRAQGLALGVDLEDLCAAGQVGVGDGDLAVEAAGAQQGGVEDVGTVGGCHEDDALAVTEAVHLHQQLVESLLAFVVSTTGAGAALAAHGIDLVDEDDAGAALPGLLEQVPHAGGAHADEHLHEVGTGDGVEGHPGLTGDGARQEGLAGAGRAVEQDAARDLRPQFVVAAGVLEEVLDLMELRDGLVGAGDIGEGVGRHVAGQFLGLGAAEAEQSAAGLHAGEEEEEQAEQQQHGQQEAEHAHQEAVLGDLGGVAVRTRGLDGVEDLGRGTGGVLRHDLLDALPLLDGDGLAEFESDALFAVVDLGFRDVAGAHLLHRHGGVDALVTAGVVSQEGEDEQGDEHNRGDEADLENSLVLHGDSRSDDSSVTRGLYLSCAEKTVRQLGRPVRHSTRTRHRVTGQRFRCGFRSPSA